MAITQTITPLSTPPSTQDVENFNDRADDFLAELPTMVTQVNTTIGQINTTETNINAKEASATTAASTATSQASIATTKASAAAASATAAYNAQLVAEAVFDAFDDKYLGAKASAPTTDNDGNALTTGALFYKTTAPKGIYVYDAELSAWNIFSFIPTAHGSLSGRSDADAHPISAISGVTAFARTLLDDTDAAAARTTLGAAPTASPTFSGTVTAPTFVGELNGHATTATTATNAVNATNAANASKLNGQVWNWSGQGGQPTWLWGGSDGTNMYVYNPANFSVNYANIAGYANGISDGIVGLGGRHRAWVCANGTTGQIYSSGNVSSITDNGVGDFTVNFSGAMPHDAYAVCGSASGVVTQSRNATIAAPSSNGAPYLKSTAQCRLFFGSNGTNDAAIFTAAFIC